MILTAADLILLGLSIAGSVFAGVLTPILIRRKMNQADTNEIIANVKQAIKDELTHNQKHLKKEDTTSTKEGIETKTTIWHIETYAFESAVKSGNFILLNSELRKLISEVYALAHIVNRQGDLISKLTFTIKTTDLEVANYNRIFEIQKNAFVEKHSEIVKKIDALIPKLS